MIAGYAIPDFVSDFWSYYIAAFTIAGIIFSLWILRSQTTKKLAPGEEAEVMAPTWDGDLQELNNPLPRWWMYLFYGLIFFSIIYLVLYPGLGSYAGMWNWSSAGQYQAEKERVDAQFDAIVQPYMSQDIMTLAVNPDARKMGENLFLTYCSQCHGSDAKGNTSQGFPDLTDRRLSLFGATPDAIRNSIANGHLAEMPANLLGDEQSAKEVANYVLSLGGKPHDAALAAAGKEKYAVCAGCHGENGKGIAAIGAPDLTDDAWEYGGTEAAIVQTIMKGRKGGMPGFQDALGDAKIKLLTAYVWGMKGVEPPPEPAPPAEAAAPAVD